MRITWLFGARCATSVREFGSEWADLVERVVEAGMKVDHAFALHVVFTRHERVW